MVDSVTTTMGTCTRTPLVCRIDTLAAGGKVMITIVAHAVTAGPLTNGASVTAVNDPGSAAVPASTARTADALRCRCASA